MKYKIFHWKHTGSIELHMRCWYFGTGNVSCDNAVDDVLRMVMC